MAADPNTLGELDTLMRVLRQYRDAVVWKLDGLTEEQARRSAVPSGSNPLGLVKHLAATEREWFVRVVGGRDIRLPFDDGPDDADWHLDDDDTVASVIAEYRRACAESDEVMAETDDPAALVRWGDQDVTVRRVVAHMLEETARHVGHLDLMRELADSSTGAFPD